MPRRKKTSISKDQAHRSSHQRSRDKTASETLTDKQESGRVNNSNRSASTQRSNSGSSRSKTQNNSVRSEINSVEHSTETESEKPFKSVDHQSTKDQKEYMKNTKPVKSQTASNNSRFSRWLYTLLIIAVLFFLSAVGFAVFTFFRGDIFISVENVQLNVIGDDRVKSGELVELEVEILNRNSVPLEEVELMVEYPSGAREPDQPSEVKSRERLAIDDIAAGRRTGEEVSFLFFGEDGDEGELRLVLEYSVPRSTARLRSRAEHLIVVSDSPVSLSIRPKTDIHAGQSSELDLVVRSHEEETIESLLIKAEYPVGFNLTRANPSPSRSDNKWHLSSLEPGESETITLIGEFAGQSGDQQTLRFSAGPLDSNTGDFLALFTSVSQTVTLRPSYLTLGINLHDGREQELIGQAGQQIYGEVSVKNNWSVNLKDLEIKLDFEGVIVDPDSVRFDSRQFRGSQGFFDHRTTEAIWSYVDLDQLTQMAPGQRLNFPIVFQFHSDYSALRRPSKPGETLNLSVVGRQTDNPRLAGQIESDWSYDLKLSSEMQVAAKGLYSTGPFSNSGPMPPVVEEPTTYTIVLGLSSSLNDMDNVVLQADVPAYVNWTNQVQPSEADLRYSAEQRRLVWHAGRLEAGRGYEIGPREVAFQVEVTPRLPHRGQVINILDNIRVEGVDTFTGQSITAQTETVTTEISEDPSYRAGDGEVE